MIAILFFICKIFAPAYTETLIFDTREIEEVKLVINGVLKIKTYEDDFIKGEIQVFTFGEKPAKPKIIQRKKGKKLIIKMDIERVKNQSLHANLTIPKSLKTIDIQMEGVIEIDSGQESQANLFCNIKKGGVVSVNGMAFKRMKIKMDEGILTFTSKSIRKNFKFDAKLNFGYVKIDLPDDKEVAIFLKGEPGRIHSDFPIHSFEEIGKIKKRCKILLEIKSGIVTCYRSH